MRRCIGCGEMKSKREMLRVLRTTEDEIILDATGRKNGRGAYLCRSEECFVAAEKAKGLERSFQCAVSGEIYKELLEELKHLEAE